MATSVGQVKAEFVGDSSKLVAAATQATTAVTKFAAAAADSATKAGAAASKSSQSTAAAANAAQKAAQGTAAAAAKAAQAATQSGQAVSKAATQAQAGAQSVKQSMDQVAGATSKAGTSLKEFGDKASTLGKSMSMKLTAPLVAAGIAGVKSFADFDFSMRKIVGLVGVNADVVAGWTGRVRDLGVQYGVSGQKTADALFYITSAGLRGETAMSVLEQSLKANAIGLGDTATIADLSTSALNAYGAANLSASDATDVMVATIREGKLKTEELAGTMGRVLPVAAAMGVKFNDVGAAFAALSRVGYDSAESATAVRQILASLLSPTKQAEDALTKLGSSSAELRDIIREQGLLAGLQELGAVMGGDEEAAAAVFGNIRALSGVLSLIGPNAQTTANIFASMADNVGDTDKALSAVAGSGALQINQAMAEMKDAFISVGAVIVPIIVPAFKALLDAVKSVANFFESMPAPIQKVLVVLAGLATVIGPLILLVGSFAKAWVAMKLAMETKAIEGAVAQLIAAGPVLAGIVIAVAAVAAAFYLFSNNGKEAKERQERLTESLRAAGDPMIALSDQTKHLIDDYKALAGAATDAAGGVDAAAGSQSFVASELGASLAPLLGIGLTIKDITGYVATGTNGFQDLATAVAAIGTNGSPTVTTLDYISQVLAAINNSGLSPDIQAQFTKLAMSGDLTLRAFSLVANSLDKTADAFDDNVKALDETNKAYVEGADGIAYFASVLGIDQVIAIRDSAYAQAEAAGRTDEHTYALEVLTQVVNMAALSAKLLSLETGVLSAATVIAVGAFDGMNDAMNRAAAAGENGVATFSTMATELGLTSAVLENQLNLVLLKSVDGSNKLAASFKGLKGDSAGIEQKVREVSQAMVQLLVDVKNSNGGIEDAVPALRKMYWGLVNGAKAAGMGKAEIDQLVNSIGILDGLAPEVQLAITLNTAQLASQIAVLEDAVGKALKSELSYFGLGISSGTRDMLNQLGVLRKALAIDTTGGGSSGSAGGAAKEVLTKEEKHLQVLKDKVKSLKEEMKSYRTSLAEALNIPASSDFSKGTALDQTRNTLKQIREFQHNMKALKDRGVPPDILQEVAAAGLVGGNALAKDIMGMTQLDFKEFLSSKKEISKIAGQTAKSVSTNVFQTKIDTAQTAVDIGVELGKINWKEFGKLIASGIKPTTTTTAVLPPGLDFSGFHASGGIATKASLGVIGESGPEAIIPLPRLGDFGGGNTTMNVQVIMPAGSDGDDVVRALQKYQRRKGSIPITVNNTRTF